MMQSWNKENAKQFSEYDKSESDIVYPAYHELLGDVSGKRIADYGCGEGRLIQSFQDKGAIVHGFDTSKDMITKARKRIGEKAAVIENGKMPLENNSLDAVISNFVLMMCPKVEDIREIFREVHRVLKLGGAWIYGITHPAFIDKEFSTYRNIFRQGFDYFNEGQSYQFVLKRKDGVEVTGDQFIDYNYSFSTYLNTLSKTGFKFDDLKELRIGNDRLPAYMVVKGIK